MEMSDLVWHGLVPRLDPDTAAGLKAAAMEQLYKWLDENLDMVSAAEAVAHEMGLVAVEDELEYIPEDVYDWAMEAQCEK